MKKYSKDSRTTKEKQVDLESPLISLNAKNQKDFVKVLFLRKYIKGAKTLIYTLKQEVIKLRKREENQTQEITRLKAKLKCKK